MSEDVKDRPACRFEDTSKFGSNYPLSGKLLELELQALHGMF